MANVLNRTTLQYKRSVNTPDFPLVDWVLEPDLSPVDGVDNIYWILTGDTLSEASQANKDIIDAANLEAFNDSTANTIDFDPYLKAFALIMLDEINILRSQHGLNPRTKSQLKNALRNKL